MPRINFSFIRQSKKLRLDTINQGIKISPGQISPSDASIKQDIAADDKTAGLMIKRNTTRRMTGSEAYLQFVLPNLNMLCLLLNISAARYNCQMAVATSIPTAEQNQVPVFLFHEYAVSGPRYHGQIDYRKHDRDGNAY